MTTQAPERLDGPLPDAAYAAALACLPGVGAAWLTTNLGLYGPTAAWRKACEGLLTRGRSAGRDTSKASKQADDWQTWASSLDVHDLWRRLRSQGTEVIWSGGPEFPSRLQEGPAPAAVLFVSGHLEALQGRPVVALVGTRRCSTEASSVAFEMAYELADAGVCIVSGLALGIDGAAHAGAVTFMREHEVRHMGEHDGPLPGTTVGVAASAVDRPYPKQHASLWREVARLGAIVSEAPPGSPPQSWRFPSRNRIIAGLADLVVVVECHLQGGSWHTVDAAERRGTDIAAVPGSVKNPAADGTNKLIRDGAVPVRHAQDVLDTLGRFETAQPGHPGPAPHRVVVGDGLAGVRPAVAAPSSASVIDISPVEDRVLRAFSSRALCLDDLVERCGLPSVAVAVALDRLLGRGQVQEQGGWWSRS